MEMSKLSELGHVSLLESQFTAHHGPGLSLCGGKWCPCQRGYGGVPS